MHRAGIYNATDLYFSYASANLKDCNWNFIFNLGIKYFWLIKYQSINIKFLIEYLLS